MSENILLKLIELVPQWFLMLSILAVALYFSLKRLYNCIEKIIIRGDAKERIRNERYNKLYDNYNSALNNNTQALNEFKEVIKKFKNSKI